MGKISAKKYVLKNNPMEIIDGKLMEKYNN